VSRLFCFGLGYSATCLARRLAAKGWRIAATGTTEASVARIADLGFAALHFDGESRSQAVTDALCDATHVLVSAPPLASGDPVLLSHRSDLALAPQMQWIGYLSTVGVYGDHRGAWVDETTPPSPISRRSWQRWDAEQAWSAFAQEYGKRVEIFRLSGIYGPGRSAIDNLQRGSARRIVKPGQVFNRIHVEDIATALEAVIAKPHLHTVYNLSDDEPAPSEDVLVFAAHLLQVAPPPAIDFCAAELSPMARSFYAECKRVSNRRLTHDLGVELAYPTYREGLRAIAKGAH